MLTIVTLRESSECTSHQAIVQLSNRGPVAFTKSQVDSGVIPDLELGITRCYNITAVVVFEHMTNRQIIVVESGQAERSIEARKGDFAKRCIFEICSTE